jgi:CTP synthase (UTP-ammonia lyase)
VGIVGDFNRGKHSHWATEAALFHASAHLGIAVEPRWISTATIAELGCERLLADVHGAWGAPGSPYVSMPGMLQAISYVRERDIPYLGTCAGFQYALIELTRSLLGIADADSAENNPDGQSIVITPVQCAVPGRDSASPRLAGLGVSHPVAGTLLAALCGNGPLREEYFCSFETNPDYLARWEAAGLRIAARGDAGEMRAFELSRSRFFLATLYQPQLSSSFEQPHPIIEGFLRACALSPSPDSRQL